MFLYDIAFKKSVKLFLSFLLICSFSFAQNLKKADSLSRILETENLSKKEKAKVLRSLAYFHPDLTVSLRSAKESLAIAEEIQEPILQAEALEEISHIERRVGNNNASLDASLRALTIYESQDLVARQAASYTQLASNYISDEDYDLAIDYLKKAIAIYEKTDQEVQTVSAILNLGEAYRLDKQLDNASVYFKQALQHNQSLQNEYIESYALGNLGMVYTTQGKLALAKENLMTAITMLDNLGDPYSSCIYLAELGKVHLSEKQPKRAERFFLKALTLAKQHGLKEQIRDFSSLLSDYYESTESYANALTYQKLYQVYQDTLVNKANIQKMEALKFGYQIDKRESEIDLLNTITTNQKQLVIVLIIGLLLFVLFTYLLYKSVTKIKKKNIILSDQKKTITKREEEKALLLRELNHRVKNNLQMISSLLNLQSNTLTGHPAKEAIVAGKYRVEALSLVHRKLYQEGVDTKINAKEYIEELVLGLFHAYEANFTPKIDIDAVSIHIDLAVPLALVINELIINSLKYAYTNINNPSLEVLMKVIEKDKLHLEVIDNGIGFTATEEEKNNSFGITLISSLIEQMGGQLKKLANQGTHWQINIDLV